jgi:hypothetical protein
LGTRSRSDGHDGPKGLVKRCGCAVLLMVCSGSAWLRVASCLAWLRVASCLAWLRAASGSAWLRVVSCLAWLRVASCLAWLRAVSGLAWLRAASCRSDLASDPGHGVVSWLRVWGEWARGPGQICTVSTWLRAAVVQGKAFRAHRETEGQLPLHTGPPCLRSCLGNTGGPGEFGQHAGTRACERAYRRDKL